MQVGSLGEIVFEVAPDEASAIGHRVRTFQDRSESGEARWATHDVPGAKPIMEFIGPACDAGDITVRLNAELGIDVDAEIQRAREYRDTGRLLTFFIGDKPIGGAGVRWVITAVGVSYGPQTKRNGSPLTADMQLHLEQGRTASTPAPYSSTIQKAAVSRVRMT